MLPIKTDLECPFFYEVKLNIDCDGILKEFEFQDPNPIMARKMALDFYISNLKSFKEKQLPSRPFEENWPERCKPISRIFGDLSSFKRGSMDYHIGVFLKTNEIFSPHQSQNSFKESILIHGFNNLNELNTNQILYGLKKEFQLYKNYDFDTKNFKIEVDFSKYLTGDNNQPDVHKILKIPFEFKKPEVAKQALALFEERKPEDWERQIEEGDLLYNAFESTWNAQQFKLQIASFLNSSGGYLFYGIDRNEMKPKLNVDFQIRNLKPICLSLLNRNFAEIEDHIKFDFIPYKKGQLLVFQIEPNYKNPIFIKENFKKLYCRDQNGVKIILPAGQIDEWMKNRKSELFEHVKTFL